MPGFPTSETAGTTGKHAMSRATVAQGVRTAANLAMQTEKDMRSLWQPAKLMLVCGTIAVVGCVMEAGTEVTKESKDVARPTEGILGGLVGLVSDAVGIGTATTNDNSNDNGAGNTNDNGADNGNDNGAGNTNDNGADNGNDNGAGNTNQNDNGSSGDICADGTYRVDTDLTDGGDGDGDMQFRVLVGGCTRFRARVDEGLAPGSYDVAINNVVVGHIVVDSRGRGELELDSEDGTLPAGFPHVAIGDVGDIGGVLFGTFALDCPQVPQTCNMNGNDNGADNTNDNGAGNTNDNGTANTNDNGA